MYYNKNNHGKEFAVTEEELKIILNKIKVKYNTPKKIFEKFNNMERNGVKAEMGTKDYENFKSRRTISKFDYNIFNEMLGLDFELYDKNYINCTSLIELILIPFLIFLHLGGCHFTGIGTLRQKKSIFSFKELYQVILFIFLLILSIFFECLIYSFVCIDFSLDYKVLLVASLGVFINVIRVFAISLLIRHKFKRLKNENKEL